MPSEGAPSSVTEGTLDRTWERRSVTRLQAAAARKADLKNSSKNQGEFVGFASTAGILPWERGHYNKELTRTCKELACSCQVRARSKLELHDSV